MADSCSGDSGGERLLYKCTLNQFCPPRRPRDLHRGPEDAGGGGQLRGDGVWGEGEARGVH